MKTEIFKMFINRLTFQKSKLISLPRFYCKDFNKPALRSSIQKLEKDKDKSKGDQFQHLAVYKQKVDAPVRPRYWNERAAIRKQRRNNRFPYSVTSLVDLFRHLQNLNNIPSSFTEFLYHLKKRHVRKQLIEQKYLPERVFALRPDLAAAHFIVSRGGSVKFIGNPEWVGYKEKKKRLPISYVPGMFVEGIKAEGTSLYCEGLPNLSQLFHLSYLSLKNLETVNDWFLDLLSQEHCENLKHLDISGCKNVTYRGLSCFYRFENLNVLEVEGIPDTTEFKFACHLLLDIKPFLDIRGIDLSVPTEIKPANIQENDEVSDTV